MFKFFTSKKGFTMVEMLITLVLLGLGAFAMTSLISAAYRSFNKTEERYEKQEMVKQIAEAFQNQSKIGSATSCSIFPTIGVLPAEDTADDAYSYVFLIPVFKNNDGTYDATYKYGDTISDEKMQTMAGYYIYRLNQGVKMARKANGELDVPCMNYGMPLYMEFSPYKNTSNNNTAAVNIRICAVDDDTEFNSTTTLNNTNGGTTVINEPSTLKDEDNVFYELTVRTHFPNMVNSSSNLVVNASSGLKDDYDNYILDSANVGSNSINGSDVGYVIRLTIDSILAGDSSQAKSTVTSFCFIATASYGADSGEVGLLCDFRDNILLKTDLGKVFVKAYYTVSPGIADIIRDSEPLKAIVRFSLKPLVVVATYALTPELLKEQLPLIITFAVVGFALSATLVHLDKKKRKSIR